MYAGERRCLFLNSIRSKNPQNAFMFWRKMHHNQINQTAFRETIIKKFDQSRQSSGRCTYSCYGKRFFLLFGSFVSDCPLFFILAYY